MLNLKDVMRISFPPVFLSPDLWSRRTSLAARSASSDASRARSCNTSTSAHTRTSRLPCTASRTSALPKTPDICSRSAAYTPSYHESCPEGSDMDASELGLFCSLLRASTSAPSCFPLRSQPVYLPYPQVRVICAPSLFPARPLR
ncbi:hypothetical protein BV20DRAFT_169650 [Pilatotrama ljubarskyi]|nr:hypothetical protein BV20DRAFT_169650 [Pilatotrama ljubarskyi]